MTQARRQERVMPGYRGWMPFGALTFGALVFAFLPPGLAPPADLYTGVGDEGGHLIVGFLITLALLATPEIRRSCRYSFLAIAVAVVLSGFVELIQPLVGRACQYADWQGGVIGVVLAAVCRLVVGLFWVR